MQCDNCRELLLDHLYDLLDPIESGAVEAHLAACPACAAARDRSAHEQHLFASAAKASFPQVTFAPPQESATPMPTVIASPAAALETPKHRQGWFSASALVGWGVAASLLIAIPTLPGLIRHHDTRTAAAVSAAAVALASRDEAQARVRSAEAITPHNVVPAAAPTQAASKSQASRKLTDDLRDRWFEREARIHLEQKRKKLGVEVIGPAAIQPGAPNEYTIVIDDRQDAKGLKQIEAQVRDEKDQVLFRQPLKHESQGERHQIKLPASLWTNVKSDSDLFLVVATVDTKTDIRTEVQDKVRLLAPVYTTMLTTDKPLYRPGERVFFRSLTLDRTSFLPPSREQEVKYELCDAKGNAVPGLSLIGTSTLVHTGGTAASVPVLGPDGKPVRGVGCGEFDLPSSLLPGEYSLNVQELRHPAGYIPMAPASRRITVRPFSTDRFQKKLEFGAASFPAGSLVNGWCEVRDLGAPVAGAMVIPIVTADGETQTLPSIRTGADGRAPFQFTLPEPLNIGDARLQAEVRVGDTSESLTRRIPTIGRRLTVEFFPEGGNLVAGVPCRVYLRATSPLGDPVDVRGSITDGREVLARVETFTDPQHPGANRGMGVFNLTPKIGTRYWLNLEKPAGANEPMRLGPVPSLPSAVAGPAAVIASRIGYSLPKAIESGVVMWVPEGVSAPGKPIVVQLTSVGKPRKLIVGAYTRGRLMETKSVTVKPGKPEVVNLAGDANPRGGVTRVTVFEEPPATAKNRDLIPLAERLVYRTPREELKLSFQARTLEGADAAELLASSTMHLAIRATDEANRPTAALLYAAVVDANAVAMAEGKLDRLLPAHFLLAGEVQKPDDLEYVDFLLSPSPLASQALDLVLGTQGWRRFAEQDAGSLRRKHTLSSPDLDRLVMLNGRTHTDVATFSDAQKQNAYEEFRSQYEAAATKEARATTATQAPAKPSTLALDPLREQLQQRQSECDAKSARAASLKTQSDRVREQIRFGVTAAGLTAFALLMTAAAFGPWPRRWLFVAGAVTSGAVAFFLASSLQETLARSPRESKAIDSPMPTSATAKKPPSPAQAPPMDSVAGKSVLKLMKEKKAESPEVNQAVDLGKRDSTIEKTLPPQAASPQASAMSAPVIVNEDVQPTPSLPKRGAPSLKGVPITAPGVESTKPQVGSNATSNKPGIAGRVSPLAPSAPSGRGVGMAGGPIKMAGSGDGFTGSFGMLKGAPRASDPPSATDKALDAAKGEAQLADRGRLGAQDRPGRGFIFDSMASTLPSRQLREQTLAHQRDRQSDAMKRSPEMGKITELESTSPQARQRPEGLSQEQEYFKRLGEQAERAISNYGNRKLRSAAVEEREALDSLLAAPSLIVREYASVNLSQHSKLPVSDDVVSLDTILWHPLIVLPHEGTITLPFRANADAAGYEILVAGHTLDGRLGAVRATVPVVTAPRK